MYACMALKLQWRYRILFFITPNSSLGPLPNYSLQFSSVQSLSRVQLFVTPWMHHTGFLVHHHLPEFTQTHVHWVSDAIQPSNPLSTRLKSFPVSGSFQLCQFFGSGAQNTGGSATTSVLPMNTQDWSPLGWTGWISLQCKGPSRVFSNTTVQRHQFFGTQLSLQSNSHFHT